jgi:hypothetical protein
MYLWVLLLHSVLRWLVLGFGMLAVVRALNGRSGRTAWSPVDEYAGLGFIVALDLQLLVGLVLLFFGPVTVLGMHEPDMMFSSRILRFFTLEHPLLMAAAIIVAHVGRARVKRAAGDGDRHRRAARAYGIALLLILLAIPWPFLSYGRPLLNLRLSF